MTKRTRYAVRHKDGYYINIVGDRSHDFMKSTFWHSEEEVQSFLHGHYAPPNPEEYEAFKVTVTYTLESEESECKNQKPSEK